MEFLGGREGDGLPGLKESPEDDTGQGNNKRKPQGQMVERVESVWRRRRKFNVSRRGLCLFGVDDSGSDAQKQQENTASPPSPAKPECNLMLLCFACFAWCCCYSRRPGVGRLAYSHPAWRPAGSWQGPVRPAACEAEEK